MIQVEKLSFGFPAKELYKDVSFTLERGTHCVLIGSNGTGKSTLADMLIYPEKYLYDGKITRDESCRCGYAGQFAARDKSQNCTVFEYLSEKFLKNQRDITLICEEMASSENVDSAFERYQVLLDINDAMDGDNYESNIRKELNLAGMGGLEKTGLAEISGGEYKILQIMREMLLAPNLLVLDEPDAFLDFENLSGLCKLIKGYKGTLLVITHNRYLLNHCFNKILHLENGELQEYDGNYSEYRCAQLKEKLELKLQNMKEEDEIQRTREMVEILRKRATLLVNPVIGSAVNAKQSQLNRLRARQIKAPFLQVREPEIKLPEVEIEDGKTVLEITDYQVVFDKSLLENVNFKLTTGEKVAIVGSNGTGKTTLIRDILKGNHPSIHIDENTEFACLSQQQGENLAQDKTVLEVMQDVGFGSPDSIRTYLAKYCLEGDTLKEKVGQLSGGEQNLLQIAIIAQSKAELLILDEPTSHLDLYAQAALENAISKYKGTVLMVSHDFYLVVDCADYVLLVEDNSIRRMSTRNFRKMVYDKWFDVKYLEADKKKQELEREITNALKKDELEVGRIYDKIKALELA